MAATSRTAVAPQSFDDASEIEVVRSALDALRLALRQDSSVDDAQLQVLLRRVIDTAAQGSLAIQQDAEQAVAQLIVATSPRSDVLLDDCVRGFNWERHETSLSPNRAVLAVLARLRDITALADLKSREDELGTAFARLSKPANSVLRWWRSNFAEARAWPELALLSLLKDKHPRLLKELDAKEIAWWERFASRPKLSYGLSRLGGVLLLIMCVGGLFGALTKGEHLYLLPLEVLSYVGLFAMLLASKLYLVDWPALLVNRRWRGRPPPVAQIGWLPMLIVSFGITAYLSNAAIFRWAAAVVGVSGCLWAIYVSGPMPSVWQNRTAILANSHLLMALIVNAALAPWWFLSVPQFTSPPQLPDSFGTASVGAVSLMCAAGFGVRALGAAWTERLTDSQRKRCTLALAICAVILVPVVWIAGTYVSWRPFVAWLVVTFVVIHRFACVNFSGIQVRVRLFLMVVLAGLILIMSVYVKPSAPVLQFGGILLLAVALVNLYMARQNQKLRGF